MVSLNGALYIYDQVVETREGINVNTDLANIVFHEF